MPPSTHTAGRLVESFWAMGLRRIGLILALAAGPTAAQPGGRPPTTLGECPGDHSTADEVFVCSPAGTAPTPRDAEPTGADCAAPGWQSRCWWPLHGQMESPSGVLAAMAPFGMNIDLDIGVTAGDYPPVRREIGASTSPLVAGGVQHYGSFHGYPERPVVHGSVDMITGVPLLREVDLEIPFGSAVFRHVRTYSELPSHAKHEALDSASSLAIVPERYHWDWHGQGWMIGENPLFLIDAGYWGFSNDASDRRCYFMPDAHQAIPFIFSEADGTYVAPPHFDAILSHNGTWTGTQWEPCPDTYYIWLHNQSVKYTIHAVRADVGYIQPNGSSTEPWTSISRHRSPHADGPGGVQNAGTGGTAAEITPGWGTPYYGLVKRIEDRFGNVIDIDHSNHVRSDCDEAASTNCIECCQNCHEKGQVTRVRLRRRVSPPGAQQEQLETEWTLVYVYREATQTDHFSQFVATAHEYPMPGGRLGPQTAIAGIYVYEGDEVAGLPTGFPEHAPKVPHLDYMSLLFSGAEPPPTALNRLATAYSLEPDIAAGLPSNWRHAARYFYLGYDEVRMVTGADDDTVDPFVQANQPLIGGVSLALYYPGCELAIVSTETQDPVSGLRPPAQHQVYRYGESSANGRSIGSGTWEHPRFLRAVWRENAVESLRESVCETPPSPAVNAEEWEQTWPVNFLFAPNALPVSAAGQSGPAPSPEPLLLAADLLLTAWGETTDLSGSQIVPSWPPEVAGLSGGANLNEPAGPSIDGSYMPILAQAFYQEMLSDYIQLPTSGPGEPIALPGGVTLVVSRVGDDAAPASRVYRFLVQPQGLNIRQASGFGGLTLAGHEHVELLRASLHEPYLFLWKWGATAGYYPALGTAPSVALDKPMWVTVIDEYDSLEDAAWIASEGGRWNHSIDSLLSPGSSPAWAATRVPRSRRVVQMNAAGYVLSESTWDFAAGEAASSGLREQYIYETAPFTPPPNSNQKPARRLAEYRSYSWSAAQLAGAQHETEGLTQIYAYDDANIENASQPLAVGYRRGSGSTNPIVWTRQWVRDPAQPSVVQYEVVFTEPAETLLALAPDTGGPTRPSAYPTSLPEGVAVTMSQSTFEANAEFGLPITDPRQSATPGMNERLVTELAVAPAAPKAPGSADYFAIQRTDFVHNPTGYGYTVGLELWRGRGTSTSSDGGLQGPLAEYFIDYVQQDTQGRTTFEVRDIGTNGQTVTFAFPGWLVHYEEPGATPGVGRAGLSPALDEWAAYQYDSHGVSQVDRYTGLRDITVRREWHDPVELIDYLEIREFKDVPVDEFGSSLDPAGPGTCTRLRSRRPRVVWSVRWIDGVQPLFTTETDYDEITEVRPDFDGSGRLSGVTVADPDDPETATSAQIEYDRYGTIGRETHPDGRIVRNVSDPMGRLERVYRGSTDQHVFWGTAEPGQTSYPNDDLVLTEKRYYGDGGTSLATPAPQDILSARQLTSIRRYRHRDANPYPQYNSDGTLASGPNEEGSGWLESFGYDWRGRQVTVTRHAEGGAVLTQTFTFYDNLDRVRFVATYGATAPDAGLDPRNLGADCHIPTPAMILAGSVAPARLSETRYNLRGQVEEQREYDPADPTGASYLATTTFYDHEGRPVFMSSPGGQAQRMVYDAKGRLIESSTGFWNGTGLTELTRTTTTYDTEGRAIIVSTLERVHESPPYTSESLSVETNPNAIASYTYNWYDEKGRLIAVADLGTYSTDGFVHVAPGLPNIPERPETAPSWEGPGTLYAQGLTLARITQYEFDDEGRQSAMVAPDGRRTAYEYDALGRQVLVTENAWGPLAERQQTAYRYEDSRVVAVLAVSNAASLFEDYASINWNALGEEGYQITLFDYGAPVVAQPDLESPLGTPISFDPGAIGAIRFPQGASAIPVPPEDAQLTFAYYPDGLLASRTDARGITFDHRYDELGNRIRTNINDGDPNLRPFAYDTPEDLIHRITYAYDQATGQLQSAAALTGITFAPVASNAFAYNPRGDLESESQQHGTVGTANPPGVIDYEWDYAPAASGNSNRLAAMIYPARRDATGQATTTRRRLDFAYGTSGSADDAISRITAIDDSILSTRLAEFDYAGLMRRIARRSGYHLSGGVHQWAVEQDFDTSAGTLGYEGLDRFGRIADLHYQRQVQGQPATQHRYEYAYDNADNPLHRAVTQSTPAGTPLGNERSWLFGYDCLNRLASAQMGALATNNTAIIASALEPTPRSESWDLDRLGNWDGHVVSPRPGAASGTLAIAHDTDYANEIDAITTTPDAGPPATDTLVYDLAGNLALDADFFYQHDGWGRLVKVSHRGNLALEPGGALAAEGIDPLEPNEPGDWIIHYTYDALGRLIRAQRPVPASAGGLPGDVYTEHYYLDGVRRVQEVHNNPVFPSGGGSEEQSMGEETGGAVANRTWVDREYIHTTGYVDETVCETDEFDYPWYHLQDANYNVTAIVHESGFVASQRTLDPYGQVIRHQQFLAHPPSRAGHQGLFFDRLNAGLTTSGRLPESLVTTGGVGGTTPVPVLGAYQNRERTYLPHLGRFAQSDPNGTASAVFDGTPFHGTVVDVPSFGIAASELFRDGSHRHHAYTGSPVARTDPSGRFSLGGMMAGMGTAAGMAANYVLPGPGNFITGMYGSLMATYSAGLSWDVEWALDWDLPDDMHTRMDDSWVALALGQGLYDSFRIEIPFTDIGFNPLDSFAGRRPLGLGPVHGDPLKHFGPMVNIFRSWKNKPGVTGLTTNMAVRGSGGQILRGPDGSTLRPDVQFWYRGRLYVYEVVNTNPAGKRSAYMEILRHNGISPRRLVYRER